jgi:hypothetical protein
MYRERYHKTSVTIKPIIEFLRDALPKKTMCPMEVKLPVDPNTIELHLDKPSMIPSSLSLDAIPKYELIGLAGVGEARKTLHGDGSWEYLSPPRIDHYRYVPKIPNEGNFFARVLSITPPKTMVVR